MVSVRRAMQCELRPRNQLLEIQNHLPSFLPVYDNVRSWLERVL